VKTAAADAESGPPQANGNLNPSMKPNRDGLSGLSEIRRPPRPESEAGPSRLTRAGGGEDGSRDFRGQSEDRGKQVQAKSPGYRPD
jgi:hypothetical protein